MKDYFLLISIFVIFLLIFVCSWIFQSHMEAQSFNKITGENISTWDAMWVQLRIDRPAIRSDNEGL